MKPLVKQLQTLLEDRDRTVREETKLLVVEIYRWIGAALKPQLTNLKPVQVTMFIYYFSKCCNIHDGPKLNEVIFHFCC